MLIIVPQYMLLPINPLIYEIAEGSKFFFFIFFSFNLYIYLFSFSGTEPVFNETSPVPPKIFPHALINSIRRNALKAHEVH